MILRPYQQRAIATIKKALAAKDNVLVAAPCAAGKTVLFCEISKWLRDYDRRILVLMDREQLVSQTANRMTEYLGESIGIACASVSKNHGLDSQVIVASRQTLAPLLANGSGDFKCNLLVLDEAHLVNPSRGQYHDILTRLRSNYPAMRVAGFTATPYRLNGGKIYGRPGVLFDDLDIKITTEELLTGDFLSPLQWKLRQSDLLAQLDRVKKSSTGELNETEQAEVLGQNVFIEAVYESWAQYAEGRKTAIFSLNIAHAQAIADVFMGHGVKVWTIHSKMPVDDVRQSIADFTAGTGVIINVGILTIGSDIPSISCIILARRTLSTALFFQIVGRGARKSKGKKDCLVIDLCGNAMIHGIDPDNPIRQETRESGGPRELKICPICETGLNSSTRKCPQCGFEFPYEEPEKQEISQTTNDTRLVDFKGFEVWPADSCEYSIHKNPEKPIPTIKCEYFKSNTCVARQWLCPQHPGFPSQKAGRYWTEMGGGYPRPRTVNEWIRRSKTELHKGALDLTVNNSGQWPEIKKVKPCL